MNVKATPPGSAAAVRSKLLMMTLAFLLVVLQVVGIYPRAPIPGSVDWKAGSAGPPSICISL